jgi:phosphinothricin acetyltransferase
MAILREATEVDAAAIAAIYAPYCDSTPISFEIVGPSADEFRSRIGKILPHYPWLVCETDGEIVGYAYASRHRERAAYRWGVDVAIYLSQAYHRRGIGRALYCSLFSMLALQGYYTAYAGITLPNTASVGLHQAVGFSPVGVYHGVGYKMGKWHDVIWLEKVIQPYAEHPSEPISASRLRGSAAWNTAIQTGQNLLDLAALA